MAPSYDELMQRKADLYNGSAGKLTGYDCGACKNKGFISTIADGYEVLCVCTCMEIRNSRRRIKNSGLEGLLRECTFENYDAAQEWQIKAKSMAERFAGETDGSWLYFGGQVGAGKTHLCTAVVGKLINSGKAARYMLWRDESVRLKAVVNYEEEYIKAINPLKSVDVLYIDDFFKTEEGKAPTTADINLAFELLNYRYINRNLLTIISSQLFVDDIIDIDEALGSRVYQRSKNYCFAIKHCRSRNWRLGRDE